MIFDYTEYHLRFIKLPLLNIVTASFGLLFGLFILYRVIRDKDLSRWFFVFAPLVIVTSFLTLRDQVPVFSVDTYNDRDASPLIVSGEITKSDPSNDYIHFSYKGKSESSSIITIDGETYYIMYIGEFKVSDSVEIEYLPSSKLVLSIDYLDEP